MTSVPAILASQMTGHQTLMTVIKRHIIGHLLQKLSLFFFHFLELNLTGKVEKHLLVRISLKQLRMKVFIEKNCRNKFQSDPVRQILYASKDAWREKILYRNVF